MRCSTTARWRGNITTERLSVGVEWVDGIWVASRARDGRAKWSKAGYS
jgi:hypothetical protein